MPRNTKIEVRQLQSLASGKLKYIVTSLTNRTRPEVGLELTEDELKRLMSESENLTVVVKPGKNR